MVATVGSMRVAFNADMARYEASLRRGEKRTSRFAKSARRDTALVSAGFARMRTAATGLVAGLTAGGVTAAVRGFQQVASSIANIGDEAKRAGVSLRTFQELKYVAEQNRIGVDALTDGLKELNLRADEFVSTGKGSAAEAFQRLGYGADELKKKLEDPSELMLEIIDRLGKFDRAAQIRIADELFGGTGGERFVQLIEQGEEGIRDTISEAHELGAVLDDEVIARADELDRKFNAITSAVGTGLKTAIVEAATAMQEFIDTFQGWSEEYERRGRAAEAGAAVGAMVGETTPEDGPPTTQTTPKTDRLPEAEWTPPTPPPGGFGGSSDSGRDKAARAAEREAEAVRSLIGQLEHELDLVGATALERETANLLRDAGAAATDEQRSKIVALISALHAEEEAQRRATAAADELRYVGRDVMGGMISDLREGKDAADILANALDRVADSLINMALNSIFDDRGGGALFGDLSTLKLLKG